MLNSLMPLVSSSETVSPPCQSDQMATGTSGAFRGGSSARQPGRGVHLAIAEHLQEAADLVLVELSAVMLLELALEALTFVAEGSMILRCSGLPPSLRRSVFFLP
jgi:hypothetical protein